MSIFYENQQKTVLSGTIGFLIWRSLFAPKYQKTDAGSLPTSVFVI